MTDLRNLEYLHQGNPTQRKVFSIIKDAGIFDKLASFDPILVGTIPLQIDIPGSDVDILCCYENNNAFIGYIFSEFGSQKNFKMNSFPKYGNDAVTFNFTLAGFDFEIFGQNVPTEQQLGYRHMMIEQRLLKENGDSLKKLIIDLKKQGLKTEPAFCKWLGFEGNPYLELLKLEI